MRYSPPMVVALAVRMKSCCLKQVRQIGLRGGRGLIKPDASGKLRRELTHQSLMGRRGIGKPEPEFHQGTTLVVLHPKSPVVSRRKKS